MSYTTECHMWCKDNSWENYIRDRKTHEMSGKVRPVAVFIKGEFGKFDVNTLCWIIQAQQS